MVLEKLIVSTKDIVQGGLWRLFPVINVDRCKDIPCDWPGAMGVPITYLDKHDPAHFEILDKCTGRLESGRTTYQRIVIRNLRPELPDEIDLADWFARMGLPLDVDIGLIAEPEKSPAW